MQFNMTLDPNEQGREDYSILFGILPRKHIEGFSAFDADNELPVHGFFVDDLKWRGGRWNGTSFGDTEKIS